MDTASSVTHGALKQLTMLGPENHYTTSAPKVTFFRSPHHETTYHDVQVNNVFLAVNEPKSFGATGSVLVPKRLGDALSGLTLQVTLPELVTRLDYVDAPDPVTGLQRICTWVENVGHFLVKELRVFVNGEQFDFRAGDFVDIYAHFTEENANYYDCINGVTRDLQGNYETPVQFSVTGDNEHVAIVPERTLSLPLNAWFTNAWDTAFPLYMLADQVDFQLQVTYSDLNRLVTVKDPGTCLVTIPPGPVKSLLLGEFLQLSEEEKKLNLVQQPRRELVKSLPIENVRGYTLRVNDVSHDRENPTVVSCPLSGTNVPFVGCIQYVFFAVRPVEFLEDQPANWSAVRSDCAGTVFVSGAVNETTHVTRQRQMDNLCLRSCVCPRGARSPVVSAEFLYEQQQLSYGEFSSEFYNCYEPDFCGLPSIPKTPGVHVRAFKFNLAEAGGVDVRGDQNSLGLKLKLATLQEGTPWAQYDKSAAPTEFGTSVDVHVYAIQVEIMDIFSDGSCSLRHTKADTSSA